jgi:hypothetical protein
MRQIVDQAEGRDISEERSISRDESSTTSTLVIVVARPGIAAI